MRTVMRSLLAYVWRQSRGSNPVQVRLRLKAQCFTLNRLSRSYCHRCITFGPLRSLSRAATLGPFAGCKRMTHRRCGVEETQLAHNWPVRRVRGHAHLLRWRRLALYKCFKMFRSMIVSSSSPNKSQIYTHKLWMMDVSTDVSPTICVITRRA